MVITLLLTFEPSIRDGAHYVTDRLGHPQLWKQVELHVIQADGLCPSLRLVHIGVEFESLYLRVKFLFIGGLQRVQSLEKERILVLLRVYRREQGGHQEVPEQGQMVPGRELKAGEGPMERIDL